MYISHKDKNSCDICGGYGPCNWCGRPAIKPMMTMKEIVDEKNARQNTDKDHGSTVSSTDRIEQEIDLSLDQ